MKLKVIGVFYIILAIAWIRTEYREPVNATAPKAVRRALPKERPYAFPHDYAETHTKLAGLFADATNIFNRGTIPVLVLPSFVMAVDNNVPDLLSLITESAYFYLYNDQKVRVVRRDYSSGGKSRIRAKHILIGRVGIIGTQIRISVRVQDISTGEILDAFDNYIDKTKVGKYLKN